MRSEKWEMFLSPLSCCSSHLVYSCPASRWILRLVSRHVIMLKPILTRSWSSFIPCL